MKRGPKASYLSIVDAADAAEARAREEEEARPPVERCGAPTSKGHPCRLSRDRCPHHTRSHRDCPFPLSALERRLWDELSAELARLGLLKTAYWPTLYGLVSALATLHEAREAMGGKVIITGANRSVKKHPALTVANQALQHVRSYSAELGLTPSALAKHGGGSRPPEEERSAMDKLIAGEGLSQGRTG